MSEIPQKPTHPEPLATYVVYDRRTGEILHTHDVSAAPGAQVPEDDQLARFILDHAVHTTGRHAGELDCLKVAAGTMQPKFTYRVDVATGR